jgi:hypothetical protein
LTIADGYGGGSIAQGEWGSCSPLKSVTIPNTVTSIGRSAFWKTGLTTITIPDSVTFIDGNAFAGCTDLTHVTIGNGVTELLASTFYDCSSLTSVIIPESVTRIGSTAFQDSGLACIPVSSNVEIFFSGGARRRNLLEEICVSPPSAPPLTPPPSAPPAEPPATVTAEDCVAPTTFLGLSDGILAHLIDTSPLATLICILLVEPTSFTI